MTPEQIQELLDKLFEIGGAVASKGFEMAIRQVYVEAVKYALWTAFWIIGIVVSIALYRKLEKWYSDNKDGLSPDDEGGVWIGRFVLALAAMVFLMCAGTTVYEIAARAINPEWYAVRLLLQAAGIATGG